MLAGCIGLRRDEVFGLRWKDIDFENNTITIENTTVRYSKYLDKDPKSEASKRNIIVPRFIILKLQNYLESLDVAEEKVCYKYKAGYYSERLGHSEAILKSTYQHVLNDMQKEAAETMNNAFEKIAKK